MLIGKFFNVLYDREFAAYSHLVYLCKGWWVVGLSMSGDRVYEDNPFRH